MNFWLTGFPWISVAHTCLPFISSHVLCCNFLFSLFHQPQKNCDKLISLKIMYKKGAVKKYCSAAMDYCYTFDTAILFFNCLGATSLSHKKWIQQLRQRVWPNHIHRVSIANNWQRKIISCWEFACHFLDQYSWKKSLYVYNLNELAAVFDYKCQNSGRPIFPTKRRTGFQREMWKISARDGQDVNGFPLLVLCSGHSATDMDKLEKILKPWIPVFCTF